MGIFPCNVIMTFLDKPIQQFLPQHPPFVMVDRILDISDKGGVVELTIREDNIFVDDGEFSAAGLLENMAQSCAARIGCINCTNGGEVKNGVIGDIRNFIVLRNPKCGEVLHTHIEIVEEIFNLTLANLQILVGGESVATASIKIALVDSNPITEQ